MSKRSPLCLLVLNASVFAGVITAVAYSSSAGTFTVFGPETFLVPLA